MSKQFIEFKGFLSFLILHELNKKILCGEDLAVLIGARKGTVLTPGTIYPALKKLRKYKLIKWKKDGRKKYYFLTDLGWIELENQYKLFSQYFYGLKKHIKKQ
ncbi:PadR family transcriptional regulator [Candidatus Woesearchaeota archaeon]|nr:PadR family transcriptional regulator [Candidatus Woesearchaeota archaeon]MCF7901170.1 PadR family transcriptional regulator [Candidatus Woesearchaeota archaeon]MCF8013816.1 PadR family transcriptional regulator [Candidatus Woesearchaeota archaeon]